MQNKRGGPQSDRGSDPESDAGPRGWLRRFWKPVAILALAGVTGGIWWAQSDGPATVVTGTAGDAPFRIGPGGAGNGTTPLMSPQQNAQHLAELKNHLLLTERTLCSYRSGTKYPQESRPIAEHPDQVYPNQPVEEVHAMRTSEKSTDPTVRIKSTQSRVYLASGEGVVFTLTAIDADGKTLPLFVTRAVANGIIATGGRGGPQVAVPFADEGRNGDAAAGDGTVSGLLVPGATGFANFSGTIRTDIKYNVGDKSGFVLFDVIYSSDTPATWAGNVREVVEDGSLNLYLKADVRQAGRYVVSGRVDDARGKPFALVSFNDLLPTGPNEVKLTVFGKLLRDNEPAFPLTLRDVDAYLLKENADPDRALMSRLMGTTFVTKMYAPKNFSDAEWQGEQRARYLNELTKDVGLARAELAQFDPAQGNGPLPATDCSK